MFFNTVLFVADNTAQKPKPTLVTGSSKLDINELKKDFYQRGRGGLSYFDERIFETGKPLPLGLVLVGRGGYGRLVRSTELVLDLLQGNPKVIDRYRAEKPGLWRGD